MNDGSVAPEELVVTARNLNRAAYLKIDAADFAHTDGPADWRTYVPKRLRELWPRLNYAAQLVGFIMAETAAQDESAVERAKPR